MAARINIGLDNGKAHTFTPKSRKDLELLVDEVNSMRILKHTSLMFASDQYLAHIQPKSIEIIRCYLPDDNQQPPGADAEDIVEITKDMLVEEYLQLPEAEKFSSRHKQPGEFMTTFLEIHTEGNVELFLRLYLRKKQAQEGRMFITKLFEQPFFRFRLPEGGFGMLVPAKINCQYTYPGPGRDVLPEGVFTVE